MPLSKEDIFKFDFGAAVLNGFKNTVFGIFNKYSHINKKYIPANKEPFITKELHKAIMKISKLRNNFLKLKTFPYKRAYTSQRNFLEKSLRNTKNHILIIYIL